MTTFDLAVSALTLLAVAGSDVNSQSCILQGEIDIYDNWYGYDSKFTYMSGDQVEFDYNVTYNTVDSIENPIILILYKEKATLNFSKDVDCNQRLAQSNYAELANLKITLSEDIFWSGCDDVSSSKLGCVGGRNFITVTNTTFLVAFARCGSQRMKISYKIGFKGYTGECQGTIGGSKDAEKFTRNLMIVTIICAINSSILIVVIVFLICRKWRIKSASAKLPIT